MSSKADCATAYRFSGMIWNELLMPNESLRSINCEQKSRPAVVSTSCVTIVQLGDPSGQNHMNGSLVMPVDLIDRVKSCSKIFSTVVSTGQFGKGTLSQPPKYSFWKCIRTETPSSGRRR